MCGWKHGRRRRRRLYSILLCAPLMHLHFGYLQLAATARGRD